MQIGNVISLSRFNADLTGALERRGRALLEAADLPEQVATMAPLEFYYVVKEIGVEDAQAILRHGSPEQLQACCDLDCWERDAFSVIELDAWLAGFAAEGKPALAHAFVQIDLELQVLFLAESLAIYDIRSEPVADMPDEVAYKETIDGFFALYAVTQEREVPIFLLIDALYENSIESAFRLLMAAKWELVSDTTETAFQFRSGRLEEMGFLPAAEAARLFAPPPKAAAWEQQVQTRLRPWVPDGSTMTLPGLYAGALAETSTALSRALAGVSHAFVVARLESELVTLINAATVAYGNDTRDLSGVMRVASYVRDTLSLGLEIALPSLQNGAMSDAPGMSGAHAPPADAAATDLVTKIPLLHLFQIGFTAVRPLQRAAQRLAADPVVAAWLNVSMHPDDDTQACDRAFLAALLQPRPLWAGTNSHKPQHTRAWQTLDDIAQTQAQLDALAQRLL